MTGFDSEDSTPAGLSPYRIPLGEDFSIMRTTPLNGMLTSLSTNYNRRNKDAKPMSLLFTIYLPAEDSVSKEYPEQRQGLPMLRTSASSLPGHVRGGRLFTMKGVVEEF